MGRQVAIGIQKYNELIEKNLFYIDKTNFIKEWWDNGDSVTLITRPRRFGKTLTMSMVECFFSNKYTNRSDLFQDFAIWENADYQKLQGTYPVISLSFSDVKETTFEQAKKAICRIIKNLYNENDFLLKGNLLNDNEKEDFQNISANMENYAAASSLKTLSNYLSRYYGKNVIILLDEYDTPIQEAYVRGYWKELTSFTGSLFNSTFKTNPYLERAIITGITRISKESIFSDLNNLEVVTTTSKKYADCFGFTEEEVFSAMDECVRPDKNMVKKWYDGFTFGNKKDIYNPWSILNYLNKGEFSAYWANTSSNALVGKLIREGTKNIKTSFEALMNGQSIKASIDEQIVYSQLDLDEQAIWSLLLAGGYLKVVHFENYDPEEGTSPVYELALTNLEVKIMFQNIISRWFGEVHSDYNEFIQALLSGDLESMNHYMNEVALAVFSYFDAETKPSGKMHPERFYHGFVLGLMVELRTQYTITSNRESGLGRYDIVLEPHTLTNDAIIIEFKVRNPNKESTLEKTLQNALQQIADKKYETALRVKGIPAEKIRKYGFAFQGKTVLIGDSHSF